MSNTSNIVRRSPLPAASQPIDENAAKDYAAFLTRLSVYDTMETDISDAMKTMLSKKKEREILQYIKTFHDRSVTCIGGTGRYAGYWQTHVGKGRQDSAVKRSKTLTGLLQLLAAHYRMTVSLPSSRKTISLKEYFPHWLEWKGKRTGNKALTLHHNEVDFRKLVANTPLGEMPMDRITTEDLDDWARELLIRKPLSSSRFNNYKIVVTGPLELAVREKIIKESPWKPQLMDYRLLFKTARKAPSKDKIFYDDEIEKIIQNCMDDYDKTGNSADIAIVINFDLGLRVGELCALKWEDIDLKGRTIMIRRQESQGKVEEAVKSDSEAGYRELPLNDNILTLLHRLRRDQGALGGFIFTGQDGKRKTSASISDRIVYVQRGKDASAPAKRIHCQRRTVGTRIAKACGLEAARQWLGHTDLQTTLRYIYTTETIDTMREYSQMNSVLKNLADRTHQAPAAPIELPRTGT